MVDISAQIITAHSAVLPLSRTSLCLNIGATPIAHFLGAIVSGSQGALTSSAKEMNLQVGHVKWSATGKYDVRGVRGEEVSVPVAQRASVCLSLSLQLYMPKQVMTKQAYAYMNNTSSTDAHIHVLHLCCYVCAFPPHGLSFVCCATVASPQTCTHVPFTHFSHSKSEDV